MLSEWPIATSRSNDRFVAKKAKRPRTISGGIAQQVIRRLSEFRQSKVVDLELFRQSQELSPNHRADASEGLEDLHPLQAVYTYVVNTVTDSATALGQLPEFKKLVDRLATAEEEYMPSGPPMSPITRSYFVNWSLFDVTIGLHDESFGSCVAAVSKSLGAHPSYVAFVQALCRTRPGLYVHEGRHGELIELTELVTNQRHTTRITSGYQGKRGDLLLLRLLPSYFPQFDEALSLTTPYLIHWPSLSDWQVYFERVLSKLGSDRQRAYESLMKRGIAPHGPRYWTEYVFEAYANHCNEVIFLEGLPDLAESRPHSNDYSRALATAKLAQLKQGAGSREPSVRDGNEVPGHIVKTLSREKLDRLPKLSETLLVFGKPLLDAFPMDDSADSLRQAMEFIEMAWNGPLLMQHGDPEMGRKMSEALQQTLRRAPEEPKRVLEALFKLRTTKYAHDPRLAAVTITDDGAGDVRVRAEARMLGQPE